MAKIFDLHSFRKSKQGQPASKSDRSSSDSGTMGRDNVRPIDFAKEFRGDTWPRSSSRMYVNAWAGLLLAVGVLCGLYLGRSDKKSTAGSPKPDAQVQAGSQASSQAQPLPKPSPVVPAARVRVESGVAPGVSPDSVPRATTSPVPRYIPVKYEATHKKVFGGCTGQLELTSARLHFSCPKQGDLDFPVARIAKAHKDGIELKSGEKYHFTIENRTKEQVEAIFLSWVNTVQPLTQASRAAF